MKLKPCKTCGVKPVLEHWSSGGKWWAVRCNNPDRGDGCDWKFNHTKTRHPEETKRLWNEVN